MKTTFSNFLMKIPKKPFFENIKLHYDPTSQDILKKAVFRYNPIHCHTLTSEYF